MMTTLDLKSLMEPTRKQMLVLAIWLAFRLSDGDAIVLVRRSWTLDVESTETLFVMFECPVVVPVEDVAGVGRPVGSLKDVAFVRC